MTNLVTNVGVVGTDVTGVGTARHGASSCDYGGDKGIFAFGSTGSMVNMSNLVSNVGVVGTDVTGVGTARRYLRSTQYGSDKGIFAYGDTYPASPRQVSMSNLVSNSGVVASDVTGVGTARWAPGACSFI